MGARGAFLGQLEAGDRAALWSQGREAVFPPGAVLIVGGVPTGRVYVLRSGRAKDVHATQAGREVLVGMRQTGDVLAFSEAVDGTAWPGTVTAVTPMGVLVVAAPTFQRFLAERPGVAMELLRVVTAQLHEGERERVRLLTEPVKRRLAHRLVTLAEEAGDRSGDVVQLRAPLSQQELATWVGASRATVNAALQSLVARGIINVQRRHIHVRDLPALRAMLREQD